MSGSAGSLEARLGGRVAIVTGGGRGVGLAIARSLAEAGAKVVVADSGTGIDGEGADPTVAREAAAALGEETAVAFTDSVASPGAARALVAQAVERFGAVDILVNNAAILRDAFLFKTDPANWEAVIRTNLSAAAYLLAAAGPALRDQAKAGRGAEDGGWGRIINILSTAGLYGNYGQAAYASAKAGLFGLTRVAALDFARSHVTANAIAPFAHTRVTEIIQPANEAQAQYKERALKLPADAVGGFAAYLASASAKDITGQLFGVRGREVMLFSQPRPVARVIAGQGDLDARVKAELAPDFTPLETDLERFNTDPIL